MDKKISSFLIGLVATAVILVAVVLILSRAQSQPAPTAAKTLSSDDLSQAKSEASGLENFANLPQSVSADELGRDNPFAQY